MEVRRDHARENTSSNVQFNVLNFRKEPTTDLHARSEPLKRTMYNSTTVVLVLSIAAIVAIILMLWPAGGF